DARRQAALHAVLILLSLTFLPAEISADPFNPGSDNPALSILMALLLSIGAPFVMLASTAPLVQRWSTMTSPHRAPWRLYALSNFGALLALLSYPLLVEPAFSLRTQTIVWTSGYLLFAATMFGACLLVWKRHGPVTGVASVARGNTQRAEQGARSVSLLSVLLAASGVVMLLAV